ncbi:MAG: hypothetical protein GX856_14400 [Gammaproteobacteria bacterium]|jgi:hypothetical protein|nr:hypothetical protein [Gammaproteobacteria bacterium]
MKSNISSFIALVFVGISIWLSFSNKKFKLELKNAESRKKIQEQQLDDINLDASMIFEAFALNFVRVNQTLESNTKMPGYEGEYLHVIYLKENACSECNHNKLLKIIEKLKNKGRLHIVAHPSNRFFIRKIIQSQELDESGFVTYLNKEFLQPEFSLYDSELVLVNQKNQVVWGVPIDFLRNELLMALVLR